MKEFVALKQLQAAYDGGENITHLLQQRSGANGKCDSVVELAYDLQTGTYISRLQTNPEFAAHRRRYCAEIARLIRLLGPVGSVLEAGAGEAITLAGVLRELRGDVAGSGLDLSWSRLAYGREWLRRSGYDDVLLCTGTMLSLPFADSSVDVVFTAHAVEPNGGREEVILRELYRVARNGVVFVEPAYEFASPEARARMEEHGYCCGLAETAAELGYEVIEHRPLPAELTFNPLNPTGVTLIRKPAAGAPRPAGRLACPRSGGELHMLAGALWSPDALAMYPVIGGIPCLHPDNAIVASKYEQMVREGKMPTAPVVERGSAVGDPEAAPPRETARMGKGSR